jgi:glycine oxidase
VSFAAVVGWLDGGGVQLADGRSLAAAAVVLCAGAWSGALAPAMGASPVPIEPVRGQLLRLRGLVPTPARVLYAGRRGYAVTKRHGVTLVGATEECAGFEVRRTEAAETWLRGVGARLLRGFDSASADGACVGLRPRSPDGLPLLGCLGDIHGGGALFTATGHYRNGVLLAPATAEGMPSVVLDGDTPPGWEAFGPRRCIRAAAAV